MKRLSREAIIRMVGSGSGSSGAAGGGGGSFDPSVLSGLATEDWTDGNYLSKNFFNALFTVHTSIHIVVTDSGGETIDDYIEEGTLTPNQLPGQVVETDPSTGETTTTTTSITSIEAKFGLWTNEFLSALGLSSGGGGGGGSSYLSDLLDVQITTPTGGDVLTYDATAQKWKNKSLPSYATQAWVQQQGYITSSALDGYATKLWVQQQGYLTSSAISDMATKTWVNNNYLPLTGGTLTGSLDLTPSGNEGGEIHLNASSDQSAQAGIVIDQYNSTFRIFGIPSADRHSKTGVGTALVIDPYAKTITGGYTFDGTASSASRLSGTGTYTAWGQQFWANGVPAAIDGDMSNVGNITAKNGVVSQIIGFTNLELNSLGTLSDFGGFIDFHYNGSSADYTSRIIEDASGRIKVDAQLYIPSAKSIRIGDGLLTWDSTNHAIKLTDFNDNAANFYATGGVSALGAQSGSSAASIPNSSYKLPYINTSGTTYYWHKLGTYTMGTEAMVTVIDIFSGNGYNGNASQNSWARITIKKSDTTSGTSNAVGVSCEQFGRTIVDGKILVRVYATAFNTGEVWVKCPWGYPNGTYTVQGFFDAWEHNNSTSSDTTVAPTHNQDAVGYYDNTTNMSTLE